MADVNANIDINIDSSGAIANLRRLEVAINDYQRNIASANTAAANSHAALNRALVDGINNTGMFSAKIAPAVDSVGRFTTALEKNKLSLGEYTRYAASQLPGLSRVFRREFDTMQQVAESRVKKMQTQYLALGQTVDGTARSISMMPRGLAPGYATDVALATQRHQMFNKMIDDGSTKLLNWGKNTQWAGRQLMVGFSVPMAALGITASKTFMEIDKATTSLRRVYGDLGTSTQEVNKNIDAVKALGKEYTKYGIALSDTVNVAATAAAAGMKNEQLTANTKESLRLATLGQIDYQQALTTTITLQNAFGTSNEELAPTVDFIGAVANQTVLSVDDLTAAIPRVAPVIKGLGGDVKDLAVLLVAMREGGVSAEQGANALKSGLANLINPTKSATEAASRYNISLQSIVETNKGDIMGTIRSLASALSSLDEFSRQQVLEKIFGKYQFARIGALFDHINEKTGQVKQAMDLLGMSTEDLAKVSDKSLSAISESTTVKFQAALEQLKISIAPLGQAFLKGITPIVNMISKIADAFNNLPDGVKNAAAVIIAAVAGIGPILLMTVGLLANGFANIIKVIQVFRKGLAGIRGDGESFKYLSTAELEAAAATDALEGSVQSLTGKLLLQKGAVSSLTQEYLRFIDVAGVASAVDGLGGFGGVTGGAPTRGAAATRGASKAAMRMATGGIVLGTGNKDTIPALLTPGESVITKEATAKYAPILHEMNKGTLPGFSMGGTSIGKTLASLMTTRSGIPGVTRGRIPILQSMTDISRSRGIRPMGGRTLDPSKPPTLGGKDRTYAAIPITRGHVAPGVHATNGDTYHPGLMFWQGKDTNHQLNAGGVTGQKILSDFRMLERSGVYPPSLMIASARELGLKEESIDAAYAELKKQLRRKRDHIFENDDFLDFAGRILYGKMDKDLFSQLFNIGTLRSGGKSVAAITFEEFKKKSFALGGISIGQALRSWQTNASAVREDPKALSAILGGMQKSSTSQTLHRSTTLGLGRGSEFNPEESAILFEALRSGNVESLVGREFSINSPVSYTAGGVEATLGALAQNTDVNRINSLINQLYQRKNRRVDDLKLLARARRDLDAGIMPSLNAKRIKELEQKTEKAAYLAEQRRLQQQIKELAPRGHQNVIFEQRFPKGSPLLDVNAQTGGAGTYMGKNVAHEQEFISPGSRVKIVDVQVDPKTGITKIITETLPSSFSASPKIPMSREEQLATIANTSVSADRYTGLKEQSLDSILKLKFNDRREASSPSEFLSGMFSRWETVPTRPSPKEDMRLTMKTGKLKYPAIPQDEYLADMIMNSVKFKDYAADTFKPIQLGKIENIRDTERVFDGHTRIHAKTVEGIIRNILGKNPENMSKQEIIDAVNEVKAMSERGTLTDKQIFSAIKGQNLLTTQASTYEIRQMTLRSRNQQPMQSMYNADGRILINGIHDREIEQIIAAGRNAGFRGVGNDNASLMKAMGFVQPQQGRIGDKQAPLSNWYRYDPNGLYRENGSYVTNTARKILNGLIDRKMILPLRRNMGGMISPLVNGKDAMVGKFAMGGIDIRQVSQEKLAEAMKLKSQSKISEASKIFGNRKMQISYDLDDTLWELSSLWKRHREETGAKGLGDWERFVANLEKAPGNHPEIARLLSLSDQGHTINAITARGESLREATFRQIDALGLGSIFNQSNVSFRPNDFRGSTPKYKVQTADAQKRKTNLSQFLFDDAEENVRAMIAAGHGAGLPMMKTQNGLVIPSPTMGFANGGIVPGVGSKDTIPALLTPGESVITKEATRKYAPILHQMNQGTLRGFAVGDENIQTSRSRAPGNIQRQTKAMTWDTREAELEILKAAGLAITNASSHIVPSEAGQPKIWKAGFLQADLQELNHYIDKTKNFAKKAMEEQETVAKIVRETGLSEKEVIRNLDYFSKGVHATTRESAMVLKELASIKGGAVDSAIASVLSTRLAGNYYETMDQRQYKSFGNPVSAYTPEQLLGLSSMQTQSSQSKFSGKNIGLPNSVHKELKKQAREELIQSGKFGGTIDDQERAVQQRYIKLVQQKEGKLRARLIAEERDFLMTRGVERNLATQLARRADLEGKLGMAAAKAEARARKNTSGNMPSPSESSPIFLGMPTMPTGKGEGDEPISPKSFSKVGAGIGMAAGLAASVLPMMMQDQNGKFLGMDANMLSMGSMFAQPAFAKIGSSIGKIAAPLAAEGGILAEGGSLAGLSGVGGPVTIAIAAAAAVTAGSLYLWRKNIDDSAKETASLTANLGVTANSVETMGKVLGVATPAQRKQMMQLGFTKNQEATAQEVIPILQSEEGQKLIQDLKKSSNKDKSQKLDDYVRSAVATKMMTRDQANVFARGVGASVGDTALGSREAISVLTQRTGSAGMMDIANKRIAALQGNVLFQQAANSSGQTRNITAAAASAGVGGALQVIGDLSNVVALANEEYQKGQISLKEYNDTIKTASGLQTKYNDILVKSTTGSMEQGGTAQAVKDQLISSGTATADQLDSFTHSLDIGRGSILGLDTAFITKSISDQAASNPELAAAMAGTGKRNAVIGRGGAVQQVSYQTPDDIKKVDEARANAEKTQDLYIKAQQNGLEAQLLGAVKATDITLEQGTNFVQFLQSGSKDALDTLQLMKDKKTDIVGAMFSAAAKQAGMTDKYIDVGLKFKQEGGDLQTYQKFINSIPPEIQTKIISTFSQKGLNSDQQKSILKDFDTMSSRIGDQNAALLTGSNLYATATKTDTTKNILAGTKKAEKAGVGQAYGNIMSEITTFDNGEQITVDQYKNRSNAVISALQNFNKGGKSVKKQSIISLMTQIEGKEGQNVTPEQAGKAYNSLLKDLGKGGEAKILKLPEDTLTKVINLSVEITGVEEAIAKLDASDKAMAGPNGVPNKAYLAQRAALESLLKVKKTSRKDLITSTPSDSSSSGNNDGTGGAKQLNAYQQYKKDTEGQSKLLPGLKNKLIDKLKKVGMKSIPEEIWNVIGTGAQGEENIKSFLSAKSKDLVATINKATNNAFNSTIDNLATRAKDAKNKTDAINKLKLGGFSEKEQQFVIANQDLLSQAVNIQNGSKKWDVFAAAVRDAMKEEEAFNDASLDTEARLQQQRDELQKNIDIVNNAITQKEAQVKNDNAAKFLATNGMTTDEMHHQIDANNRIIQQEQDKINAKQSEIDALSRQDELNNRISNGLSHDLEIMSQQEQKIRDTYQERVDALNKVAAINEHISQQQQNQIGLAKALSEGDVYAAAQAAQQMQQDQAQYARQQQQDALQTGMQNAVDNLKTPSGLTKKQAEQQINGIKEQSYQIGLRIRDVQDEIYTIQNGQMKTLQEQNDQYSRKLQYNEEDLNWQLQTAKLNGQSLDYWKNYIDNLNISKLSVNGLAEAWRAVIAAQGQASSSPAGGATPSAGGNTSVQTPPQTGTSPWGSPVYQGSDGKQYTSLPGFGITVPLTKATGGLVLRRYASGGHVNMDSVPAMLTPGEFVMRKAAVHKYGIGALSDMNTGRWDVPKYNTGKLYAPTPNVGTPSRGNMQNNISAPVYNTYSINVPVNQPGASADEIASKVMMKIKNIENSSIRRIGGY